MDPEETLEEIRQLVAAHDRKTLDKRDVDRLTDLIGALDRWMSHGGAKPQQWLP